MHLEELLSFILSAKQKNWPVYLAAIDVSGAFDAVPRASLEAAGVSESYCRFLHIWLSRRRFQVCLLTPKGTYYSSVRPVSRGLPRGGVVSSFGLHILTRFCSSCGLDGGEIRAMGHGQTRSSATSSSLMMT